MLLQKGGKFKLTIPLKKSLQKVGQSVADGKNLKMKVLPKKYYMLIFVKTFLKCRFLIFFHLSLTFIIKIQILNPVILLSFRLQSIHFKNAFLPHDATTSK